MSKEGSLLNKRFRFLVIALLCLLCGCSIKGDNLGAKAYKNGKCVAFYPPQSEKAKAYAMKLCEREDEMIFDYVLEKAGDYEKLTYLDGNIFYLNADHSDLNVTVKSGAEMLSAILRYDMKKEGIEEAYTSAFWQNSAPENLSLRSIEVELINQRMKLYFKDFDYTEFLPITYLEYLSGINLGFGYRDDFEKKIYIDPKRPMVALTYDDGPYETVDSILYEILDAYGGRATFYAVGSRMTKAELDSMERGIGLGMEFGSHSEYHESLSKQDVEEAAWAIMEPVNYVKEKLGYEMKTYRPPYGNRNHELEEVIGMPAVLWTLDSKDWSNRDEDITHDKIINNIEDGDIVLMHSLYMSSANATRRLVPELIDEGYQLVTVSELLKYKGYDIENLKVIGNN